MPEGKGQVIGKRIARPIALVKNLPGPLFPPTAAYVLFRDATWSPDRPRNGECVNERRPASQPGAARNGLLLEGRDRVCRKSHSRKLCALVEKCFRLSYEVE